MANKLIWAAPETISTLLSTELNSLAAAALSSAGTAYDNETNKYRWGSVELVADWDTTGPTAGGTLDLYFIPSVDGTNYMDSTTSVPLAMLVATFTPRTILTSQRLVGRSFTEGGIIIPIPPLKFKGLLINNTDQPLTASGHTVKLRPYNEELQ